MTRFGAIVFTSLLLAGCDIEFEGRTYQPAKATTLWFHNKMNQEIGACSMHSCDTGRCLWRVRFFARHPDGWRLRSGYDLAKPLQ